MTINKEIFHVLCYINDALTNISSFFPSQTNKCTMCCSTERRYSLAWIWKSCTTGRPIRIIENTCLDGAISYSHAVN